MEESDQTLADEESPSPPAALELEPEPEATFRGNSADLTALAATAAAVFMGISCFTCNMGYYCLPFLSIILGVIGLATAGSAVDKKRTRLFSWIGVGMGGLIFLLMAIFIITYFGFFVVLALTGNLE